MPCLKWSLSRGQPRLNNPRLTTIPARTNGASYCALPLRSGTEQASQKTASLPVRPLQTPEMTHLPTEQPGTRSKTSCFVTGQNQKRKGIPWPACRERDWHLSCIAKLVMLGSLVRCGDWLRAWFGWLVLVLSLLVDLLPPEGVLQLPEMLGWVFGVVFVEFIWMQGTSLFDKLESRIACVKCHLSHLFVLLRGRGQNTWKNSS